MSVELAEPTLVLSDSGLTRLRSSHVSFTSVLSLRRSSHVDGARRSASEGQFSLRGAAEPGARSLGGRRAPAPALGGRDGEPPTTHASSSACIPCRPPQAGSPPPARLAGRSRKQILKTPSRAAKTRNSGLAQVSRKLQNKTPG